MSEAGDLHDFAKSWLSETGGLSTCTSPSTSELAHELLHLRIVCHAAHSTHLLHHACHLSHVWLSTWTTCSWHSAHSSHSSHATWLLTLLLLARVLARLSNLKWSLLTRIRKQLVGIQFEVVLHLTHQRCNLSTERSRKELFRKVDDIRGYTFSDQELRNLISEIVAVVLENIVSCFRVSWCNVFEQFHKHFLRYFCLSQVHLLSWLAYHQKFG